MHKSGKGWEKYVKVGKWGHNDSTETFPLKTFFFNYNSAMVGVAQWIEHQPVKGHQFDSWSGHMPGCLDGSPVGGVPEANNRYISHTLMFLSLFLPPPL